MVQRIAVLGLCLLAACGSSPQPQPQPQPVTGTNIDPAVSGPLASTLASQAASLSGPSALASKGAALALQAGVQADSVTIAASALAPPPGGGSSAAYSRGSALMSGSASASAFQLTLNNAPEGSSTQVYSGVLMFQSATEAVLAAGVSPGGTIPPSLGLILSAGQLWVGSSGQQSAQFVANTGQCPFAGTLPAFVTACTTAYFSNAGFAITASTPFGSVATGSKTASMPSTSLVGVALTVDCSQTTLCPGSPTIVVNVSPPFPTVQPNGTQQFAATVTGASNTDVTWSVVESNGGTVTNTGLYTAPGGTGLFHVRATSQADNTTFGQATVTVSTGSVVSISISPGAVSVPANATQQFMATVTGVSNTAVTWAVVDANGGSVSSTGADTGLYTAPASPGGPYHVRATSAGDTSAFAEAVVTVTGSSGVAVSISPSTVTLPESGRVQFTATVTGATNTAVTWSVAVAGGGGTVSNTGLYSTPLAPGVVQVIATSVANTSATATATVTVTAPAPTWAAAAGGSVSSVAVDGSGKLWTWGYNGSYQLGNGSTSSEQNLPGQIATGFASVSEGIGCVFAIASGYEGDLWAWGQGPLGLGVASSIEQQPVLVEPGYATVSAGALHVLAVKVDGTLWAWGQNGNGELGDGTQVSKYFPVQIGTDTHWASVSAGYLYSMAVKTDGTLWAWGDGSWGKLGLGNTTQETAPVEVGPGYATVSAGANSTYAVKTDGTLWAWGYNADGELGDGSTTAQNAPEQTGTGFASVAAGTAYNTGPAFGVAVTTAGVVWAWGDNSVGELGNGTLTSSLTQVMVGTGYARVYAGQGFVLAVKTDGSLWGWGQNTLGELGIGTTVNQQSPVRIGP